MKALWGSFALVTKVGSGFFSRLIIHSSAKHADRQPWSLSGLSSKTYFLPGCVAWQSKRFFFMGDSGYRTVPRGFVESKDNPRDQFPACPAFKEIGEVLGAIARSVVGCE